MVSELKTLKDMTTFQNVIGNEVLVHKLQLKEEAIKWVKANKSNYYSRNGMDETKLWIKHFFNITEEKSI